MGSEEVVYLKKNLKKNAAEEEEEAAALELSRLSLGLSGEASVQHKKD